jgi:predicted nucleotidyltransferase component of viral defense system
MLHFNTIESKTLELLKKLSLDKSLDSFFLVGGTALALQIGHRISVDLDFFCLSDFDENKLSKIIVEGYEGEIVSIDKNSISAQIMEVKVEFIAHQYPMLNPILNDKEIKLASIEDLSAMKINACRNRGTKKDFVDLYFILQNYSIESILSMTNQKYPNHVDLLTLKSLLYFTDADSEPDCEMLIDANWTDIKSELSRKILPLIN